MGHRDRSGRAVGGRGGLPHEWENDQGTTRGNDDKTAAGVEWAATHPRVPRGQFDVALVVATGFGLWRRRTDGRLDPIAEVGVPAASIDVMATSEHSPQAGAQLSTT